MLTNHLRGQKRYKLNYIFKLHFEETYWLLKKPQIPLTWIGVLTFPETGQITEFVQAFVFFCKNWGAMSHEKLVKIK